jgi:hypothetical protein
VYSNLGHEQPGDVVVLCDGCHRAIHGLGSRDTDARRPADNRPPRGP